MTPVINRLHLNALGSVVALSNEAGAITESYAYSPYGEVNQVSLVGNPYLYTGREHDPETGLYYYRNRYYDAALGRFLEPDPIGYQGGMNFYAYVGGNPTNFVDPLGLFWTESAGSQSDQGLGQPVETNGPGPTAVPRLPDFFSINASVAIPTLWTGTLIGLTGSATVDENGNFYLGLGPSVGKTLTFVSGSAAFGWLNQKANPTEDDLRSFLTGHGLDAGGGFWGGGAITYSPSTGSSATNLGIFTPQAGGGYTYSWHVGDLWD
jgi:RHS repeat-associated protein